MAVTVVTNAGLTTVEGVPEGDVASTKAIKSLPPPPASGSSHDCIFYCESAKLEESCRTVAAGLHVSLVWRLTDDGARTAPPAQPAEALCCLYTRCLQYYCRYCHV